MKRLRLLMVALVVVLLMGLRADRAFASTTRYVKVGGTLSGDCSSPGIACGSLAYAISQAVSGDTILIGTGTYTTHAVTSINLTIDQFGAGSAPVLDGGTTGRVLEIDSAVVGVFDVVIQNGFAVNGAGIYNKGGSLTMQNDVVQKNIVKSVNSNAAGGGGIDSTGSLSVTKCTFTDNVANGSPGSASTAASAAAGGAIRSVGSLSVLFSTFTNNQALGGNTSLSIVSPYGVGRAIGGAIDMESPTSFPLIEGSSFDNNVAQGGAGGLVSASSSFSGSGGSADGGALRVFESTSNQVSIETSTFHANKAIGGAAGTSNVGAGPIGGQANGGAIETEITGANGLLTVANSTFNANEAHGGDGGSSAASGARGGDGLGGTGGALIDFGGGVLTANVTIAGNSVTAGGGGQGPGGPGNSEPPAGAGVDDGVSRAGTSGAITLENSIVASNTPDNCAYSSPSPAIVRVMHINRGG